MDLTVRTTTYSQGDQTWLGSAHGTKECDTVELDISTFVQGTHYANGYIPSGVCLGKITASGKYGPYSDAAGDGRTTAVGFLLYDVDIDLASVPTVAVGALMWHGEVIEARLPTGHGLDAAGKVNLTLFKFV